MATERKGVNIMNVNFIPEEKELLIAAVANNSGDFFLPDTIQTGRWVRAGGKDFKDNSDPAVATTYLEAYRNLCEREYIEEKSERYAILTGSGFEIARELAEEYLKANPPQDEAD